MLQVLLIAVAVALAALWLATERRHRRTRRRLGDLERRLVDTAARSDRVERHVYAMLARAAASVEPKPAGPPVRFLSQFGEDALLFDLFDAKRDGFFIEAGAYDGTSLSTTYALEAVGWTGLLVEPMPERVAQCRVARPRSRVVHAAVAGRGASGTTSFEIPEASSGAMADLAASIQIGAEVRRKVASDHGASVRVITVPVTSLGALLDESPPRGGIDVAVIDVEGFEAQALEGLELGRYRPRVLLVEDLSRGGDERTAALLRDSGYRRVTWLGHNALWVDTREATLLDRAMMLAGGGAVREGRS